MSQTFTLTGTDSEISVNYFPPVELKANVLYKLGLIGFYTYNTIPNVDLGRNKFYYGDNGEITIDTGVYEITDIEKLLQDKLGKDKISLKVDKNTQKCTLTSNYKINFERADSIHRLLGFSGKIYKPKDRQTEVSITSDLPVQALKVVTVRLECNITSGAYYNSEIVHTIHEFGVDVDSGYAINEVPRNIIYYPVNSRTINNITVRIVDQDGDLINFQNELVVIRLELKEWE